MPEIPVDPPKDDTPVVVPVGPLPVDPPKPDQPAPLPVDPPSPDRPPAVQSLTVIGQSLNIAVGAGDGGAVKVVISW